MALTEQNKSGLLAEAFDSRRVTFWCKKHNYFGPVEGKPEFKPASNCKDCWQIWFIHELSSCPPDKRKDKLDEIEEVMHKMVEMVERGTWDLELYPHAQIEIGSE